MTICSWSAKYTNVRFLAFDKAAVGQESLFGHRHANAGLQ
jgi:hypothetical protein